MRKLAARRSLTSLPFGPSGTIMWAQTLQGRLEKLTTFGLVSASHLGSLCQTSPARAKWRVLLVACCIPAVTCAFTHLVNFCFWSSTEVLNFSCMSFICSVMRLTFSLSSRVESLELVQRLVVHSVHVFCAAMLLQTLVEVSIFLSHGCQLETKIGAVCTLEGLR